MELLLTPSSTLILPRYKPSSVKNTRNFVVAAKASRDDNHHVHHGGKLVDQNMIVLRMRIKEMKTMESGGGEDGDQQQQHSNWMGWEKKYFATDYNGDIVEGMGLLQSFLMNTRPSVALGMLAVLALSLPISTSFLLVEAVDFLQGLVSGFHAQ